jgi:hypothetical protein
MMALDKIGIELCLWLEDGGIVAVPIPSDNPYEHYEPERLRGQAILSMRHNKYKRGLLMKRDMELIRKILFAIEEQYVDTAIFLEIDNYNLMTVGEHCKLLNYLKITN